MSDDTRSNWWMDADCRWHRGDPPADWWQGTDSRWRPPGDVDATVEIHQHAGRPHSADSGSRDRPIGSFPDWPRWLRIFAPLALVVLTLGVIGAITAQNLDDGLEAGPGMGESTALPPSGGAAPPTTTAIATAPRTAAQAAAATPPGTTPPPESTTSTAAPDPAPAPPTTRPPASDGVRPAGFCSPEGATAVSADGQPLTCTTQKCHGAPFDQPRWRPTVC